MRMCQKRFKDCPSPPPQKKGLGLEVDDYKTLKFTFVGKMTEVKSSVCFIELLLPQYCGDIMLCNFLLLHAEQTVLLSYLCLGNGFCATFVASKTVFYHDMRWFHVCS